MSRYPTTFRKCEKCGQPVESGDSSVCVERLVNIPYVCKTEGCGHSWIVKLPAITDFERRQAHQLLTRQQLRERQESIADQAAFARQVEELRRRQVVEEEARRAAEVEAARAALEEAPREEEQQEHTPRVPERKFFK